MLAPSESQNSIDRARVRRMERVKLVFFSMPFGTKSVGNAGTTPSFNIATERVLFYPAN
jgi:hypothetical protein